jgi:electron transfer flavoprotein beta subunit
MNIVVCVKQIPDPAMPGQLDPGTKTLKREGKLIMDESDSFGVEMGLQLAEKAGGGEVTIVSMVPSSGVQGIRQALAMGAAKAILVSDDALSGTDALGTAKVLAAAIKRAGDVDLVLTATESTDGYTGTVPAQVAELLGWPSLTFARAVDIADGKVKIERQTETGYDVVESDLPVLITLTAGANEPRYPTLKGIMQAKQKQLDQLDAAALGLAPDALRSSQRVADVADAAAAAGGETISGEDAPARIADLLVEARVL